MWYHMRLARRSGESYLDRSGAGRALRLSDLAVERQAFRWLPCRRYWRPCQRYLVVSDAQLHVWTRFVRLIGSEDSSGVPLTACPADLCSGLRAAVMLRCGWRLPKAAVAAELRGAACTVCPLGTIRPTAALHALDAGFNRRWCPRSQARVGLGGGDATPSEGRLWGFCSGRLELSAWLPLVQATRACRVRGWERLFAPSERF